MAHCQHRTLWLKMYTAEDVACCPSHLNPNLQLGRPRTPPAQHLSGGFMCSPKVASWQPLSQSVIWEIQLFGILSCLRAQPPLEWIESNFQGNGSLPPHLVQATERGVWRHPLQRVLVKFRPWLRSAAIISGTQAMQELPELQVFSAIQNIMNSC